MGQQLRRVTKRRRRKLYLNRKKAQAKEAALAAPIKKPAKASPKKAQPAAAE